MHGYRAVHVVVYIGGLPVEIQVRTKAQDQWANAFEKFADVVGRGIRYGESPDEWTILMSSSVIGMPVDMSRETAEGALEYDPSDEATKRKIVELLTSDNLVDNTVGSFEMVANSSYSVELIKCQESDNWGPEEIARLEELQATVESGRQVLERTVERIVGMRSSLISTYSIAREAAVQSLTKNGQDLSQIDDSKMKVAIVRAFVRILHGSD